MHSKEPYILSQEDIFARAKRGTSTYSQNTYAQKSLIYGPTEGYTVSNTGSPHSHSNTYTPKHMHLHTLKKTYIYIHSKTPVNILKNRLSTLELKK